MSDPGKSCLNCPSLLPATDASFFRKSIGVPVCAKFGKPIGRISSSNRETENIARQFAANCDEYGKPKPATPNWDEAKFQVTTPDPATIGIPRATPELVTSCAGCKFFVREDVVAQELGWTSAICSAKGKLLLASRYSLEARHCTEKDFGDTRLETTGLMYLPEYEDNFSGSADPVRAFVRAKANFVDPTEYETDKPVAPEDEDKIRAWRKITDPITGNEVFLPIFRADYFTAEQQAMIPSTGDEEHPEDYVDHSFLVYKVAVLWTELDETPGLWGQAGTGKTELFRHLAYLMQLPFYRFSITGSTEVDELVGTTQFTQGVGTHFDKGMFVKAWESECVIVVDEYNVGKPDVQQILRPCIDNSKQLVLTMAPGAPKVARNLDCYLGVAMNPAWDVLNVGANPISDADANRLMHMHIEIPPRSLEEEIIKTRCLHDGWEIPPEKLEMVMLIAEDLRALCKNGTLPVSWAIRPQLKVARALRWFEPMLAYKMASGDFLEPEAQEILLNVVRTHMES